MDEVDGLMGSDVFEALRRLALFRKEALDGRPSDRQLGRLARVAPTTVGEWLRGSRFPQRVDGILRIVEALRERAVLKGLPAGAVEAVLSDEKWRALYQAEAVRRARVTAALTEGAHAQNVLEVRESERIVQLPDQPRLFTNWTAEQLGVHPAIEDFRDASEQEFRLPQYVPRAHDAELLRALLRVAETRSTSLVVIRGGSCSGKTRTAYEALKSALPEWSLIFPKSVSSLLAALDAGAVREKTVLWLNDAHHMLMHERGEEVSIALRRLLELDGPLIVVATLWTIHHRLLTATPTGMHTDKYLHARELLRQETRIDVPASFDDSDLRNLYITALEDRSLSLAVRSDSRTVTQFLAAAPDLLDHYEQADGLDGLCGKAVIAAAMDARRLGLTEPIPKSFLKRAASGYMEDEVRASCDPNTWFDSAIAYATESIKGVASAFVNVPHPTEVGCLPEVVDLADYLDYHGRAARKFLVPPTSFWAAVASLESTDDLLAIATAAQERLRFRYAYDLYCEAARRGHVEALRWAAFLREDAGHSEESMGLRRQAAEHGDQFALRDIARAYEMAGEFEYAEKIARQVLRENGYATPLWEIAVLRLRNGDRDSARLLLGEAAEAGSIDAVIELLQLALKDRDRVMARYLLDLISHEDHTDMICEIALGLKDQGEVESAEWLLQRASDLGDLWAKGEIGLLRKRSGRRDEARAIFKEVAEAGLETYLLELGRMSEEEGETEEAESMYLSAAVEDRYEAPFELARLWDASQRSAEAEKLVTLYAEGGNFSPLMELARHRRKTGNEEGANVLVSIALGFGNTVALSEIAGNYETSGDLESAERYARQAADAGEGYALLHLARKHDSNEKWRHLLMYGLEVNGRVADPW